ncbi:unnamed protein product, partial [Chrysoparadoxa australica]
MVDILRCSDSLGPSGYSLSMSEKAGLEVSMLQRKQEQGLERDLMLWGKLMGDENDYLVCYTLRSPTLEEGEFPIKEYYYCTVNDTALRQMPQLNENCKALAAKCKGRFKGDPSLPLDKEPEEQDDGDEEAKGPERFREVHRLAYTVQAIDRDVAVIPKGALIVEPSHKITMSSTYAGLTYEQAGDIRSYYHFRRPENIHSIAALAKKGLVKDDEFLDPLSSDKPAAMWSLTYDSSSSNATLRSFLWPGYVFFAEVG